MWKNSLQTTVSWQEKSQTWNLLSKGEFKFLLEGTNFANYTFQLCDFVNYVDKFINCLRTGCSGRICPFDGRNRKFPPSVSLPGQCASQSRRAKNKGRKGPSCCVRARLLFLCNVLVLSEGLFGLYVKSLAVFVYISAHSNQTTVKIVPGFINRNATRL